MTDTTTNNPFEYRTIPKNNWELIWWAITDKNKILKYVENLKLGQHQEIVLALRIYLGYLVPIVCVIVFFLWFIGISVISFADLPNNILEEWWEKDFLVEWNHLTTSIQKLQYLFLKQCSNLLISLFLTLFLGVFLGLGKLFRILILGLILGLIGALIFSLAVGVLFGLGLGYVTGFIFGLVYSLFVGLRGVLFIVSFIGLLFGLLFDFALGIGLGGISSISLIWLVLFLQSRFDKLEKNIYIISSNIDLSLFLEQKFIAQAQDNPRLTAHFVKFLLVYRFKNHNMSALLSHIAIATLWKETAIELNEKKLVLPNYQKAGFIIPETWQNQLDKIKNNLIVAEQTTQISLKKDLFTEFVKSLEDFRQILLIPRHLTWRDKISMTRRIDWQKYYREAIEEWIRIAKQKLQEYE